MALRSLDLFSGVAGLSKALEAWCTPQAFCEIDPHARAVLRSLKRRGLMPADAPIHQDVCKLDGKPLKGKIDIIVGGFPCVGFSPRGKREGFQNSQSALFSEVIRLANETEAPLLFMENVPAVCSAEGGMDFIVASLGGDYDITWVVLGANQVGAPHARRRFYALCRRRGVDLGPKALLDLGARPPLFDWSPAAAPPAMVLGAKHTHRNAQMGNGVCVQGVTAAFVLLWSGLSKSIHGTLHDTDPALELRLPVQGLRAAPSRGLSFGAAIGGWKDIEEATPAPAGEGGDDDADDGYDDGDGVDGPKRRVRSGQQAYRVVYSDFMEPATEAAPRRCITLTPLHHPHDINALLAPCNVRIDPKLFQHAPGGKITSDLITKPMRLAFWPTPRHGNTGTGLTLTARSIRDLPTVVRFAASTPDELRPGSLNAQFTEWLQALPPDWSLYDPELDVDDPSELNARLPPRSSKSRAEGSAARRREGAPPRAKKPRVDVTLFARMPDAAYDTASDTEEDKEDQAAGAAATAALAAAAAEAADEAGYMSADW